MDKDPNVSSKLFSFPTDSETHNIRTVLIDGVVWFVAVDIAKSLGYKNYRDAIKRHCKKKGVVKHDTLTKGGCQELTYIDTRRIYKFTKKGLIYSIWLTSPFSLQDSCSLIVDLIC